MIDKNKLILNSKNFSINTDIEKPKAIELNQVSFKYLGSEINIFENLSLNIERNKHTVITGPNGSGKSTFLGICSGVFFPDRGKVEAFSENFGYVGVSPLIFTDTLKNNLLYGNKHEVDQEEIVKMVNLFQLFNESSEIDLNMQIDNKSLSSGQMQKISFIRALLSKVDILILDESMSNLDSKTKTLIYRVLNQLDLTIINSTHSIEDLDYDTHLSIKIEDDMRKVVLTS